MKVENIFNRLGLTHSEALKLFYNQDGNDRLNDSEIKVLESIVQNYKNDPNVGGRCFIWTTKKVVLCRI